MLFAGLAFETFLRLAGSRGSSSVLRLCLRLAGMAGSTGASGRRGRSRSGSGSGNGFAHSNNFIIVGCKLGAVEREERKRNASAPTGAVEFNKTLSDKMMPETVADVAVAARLRNLEYL